jgi:hypothetical protein
MQKKEYTLGGGEMIGEGALGPGAADGTLGLFLLPVGRPGRRFIGADDEATAVAIVALFLLPRGRLRPRFLILLVDVGDQRSLCVVNDQPVGNPKRKV